MHRIEAYVRLAVIFIVLISLCYLPILFALKKKGKCVARQISYVGLFCAIFLIIFATILFVPITFHPEQHILNLRPFAWVGTIDSVWQFLVEKLPNVMLFIPLGFFVPAVFSSKRKLCQAAGIAFIMTFGVEFVQYFIGRSSDIDDIITNLMGAVIGYGVFRIFGQLFCRQSWWNRFLGNSV